MAPKPAPSLASAYSKAAVKLSRNTRSNRVAPGAGGGDQQQGNDSEPCDDALQAFLEDEPAPSSIASMAVQLGANAVSRVFGALRSGRASGAASPPPPAPPEKRQAAQDDEPAPAPLPFEQEEQQQQQQQQPAPAPQQRPASSAAAQWDEPGAAQRPAAEQQESLPPAGPPLQADPQPEPPLPQQPDLMATSSSAFTPRRAGGLYEALKQQQPAEVREQVELDEAYWDAEGLQERRQELQRRLRDEEMLERIKRRVAGEKINLPSVPVGRVLNRLQTMLSPRGAVLQQAASPRSEQPTQQPLCLSARTPQQQTHPDAKGDEQELLEAVPDPHSCPATTPKPGSRWQAKVHGAVERIVQHPDFGLLVTLLIVANCCTLALYQPQLPDSQGRNLALKQTEIAINAVFTVEQILVCIAAGGLIEYLRSPWNLFDLSMVLVGYLDFIPSGSASTGGLRALRALRALRPLRTITRFESLRTIVVCFLEALPLLVSVYELLLFFLVLAAIMATVLFLGSMHFACFDSVTGMQEAPDQLDFGCGSRTCPANYTCTKYDPMPPLLSSGFGNIGASLLSCFQVITLSSWVHIMYRVMDNTGVAAFLFFIMVVLLEAYYVVNLFLAVLKSRFAKAQELYAKVVVVEEKQHSTIVTLWKLLLARVHAHSAKKRAADEQRMSERTSRGSSGVATPSSMQMAAQEGLCRHPSMRLPTTKVGWMWYWLSACWFEFRWHVRQVVERPAFDYFFLACIVVNTVLLAMTTAGMSAEKERRLNTGSTVFTVLFAVECVVKLVALGTYGYFGEGMNCFDFIVVVLSLVDTFAQSTSKLVGLGVWGFWSDPFNRFDLLFAGLGLVELVAMMGANASSLRSLRTLRILRSLRVLRVLKAFRYLQSLRVIVDVLMSSMGSFLAISCLMVLFIFCFAVIGLQTFGQYDLDPGFPNFHNMWYAVVLVFQTLTLENWGQLMFSVQTVAGWPSALYFLVWVALGKWTLLTLFLAITLSAFEANYEKYYRGSTGGSVAKVLEAVQSVGSLFRRLVSGSCFRRGKVAPGSPADDEFMLAWVKANAAKPDQASLESSCAAAAGAKLSAPQQQEGAAAAVARKEAAAPAQDQPAQGADGALIAAVHAQEGEEDTGCRAGSPDQGAATPVGGHVSSLVAQFEALSPAKAAEARSASAIQLAADLTGTAASPPCRQRSRHARFADGEDCSEGSMKGTAGSGRSSVASALSEQPQGVPAAASEAVTPSQPPSMPASAAVAKPPQPEQPPKPAVPARQLTDQSVPSDLMEAERRSELSGLSGSSCSSALSRLSAYGRRRSRRSDYPPLMGESLFCLKASNRFRSAVYSLVTLQAFDYVLVLVVLLSCVEMAMETPHMDPAATRTIVLRWIDVGTTIVFWVEALLKIIAFSFRAYISYFTNKIDLSVVILSTVVLVAESMNARFLKALRVLRAIKPLRVLTRSMSMLLVFHTLTRSLMEMGNVTILCALCFLIFAILGVQLFAGLFWSCNDTTVAGKADCVGTFMDSTGEVVAREWTNLQYNFDNIGNAFLLLFITATLDGYTPAMYMSMSARSEPGLQPYMGANSAAFLFWFFYITLVAFFVLNLYVGVVFYQFQRLKMMSQTGSAVLTASQTGYVEMMKAVFRLKPLDKAPLPENRARRWCHRLAYHPWFDHAMTAVIVANIVLLATTYYGEPQGFSKAKEYVNTAFSCIVVLECLVKAAAMGPKLYWRSNWNKFDVLLTLAAVLDILTQVLNTAVGTGVNLSTIKKVIMLLRTLRMFKLMRKVKGLQVLMTTLIVSLPAIFNVGSLLLLLFFIYAYMGVLLLGKIVLQENGLNAHSNFQSFPSALLTLFRVAVGDDWTSIMSDCSVQPPNCDPEAGNCGSPAVVLYFISFYLSVGMIAFNLFTTVILENFERVQDTEAWKLTPAALDEFCELWAQYDDGSSLIDPKHLELILTRMPPPMGLGSKATGADVLHFVFALDIPLVDGKVPFYRTVFELVQKSVQCEIPPGELKRKMERMIRRFLNKHTVASTGPNDEHMSFAVALTVMRIQRHWRRLVATRAERAQRAAEAAAEAAAAEAAAQQAQQQGEQEGSPTPAAAAAAAAAAGKGLAKAPSKVRRLLSRLSSKASSVPAASTGIMHWTEER